MRTPPTHRLPSSCAAPLGALFLAGCVPGATGTVEATIFGGDETEEHPEVGWVSFEGEFLCSAVLVAPSRALTAAHCVYGYENDPGVLSVVFASGTARPPSAEGVEVEAIHFAPDYTTLPSHDLAAMSLTVEAPTAPVPWRAAPLTDENLGDGLRLVGFGIEAVGETLTDPVRREAEVALEDLENVTVRWFSEDAGLCYGDSGGAVFLVDPNGQHLELAAIATEGDAGCDSRGAGVRTDTFSEFLTDPGAGDDDLGDDDGPSEVDPEGMDACVGCAQSTGGVALLPALLWSGRLRRRR